MNPIHATCIAIGGRAVLLCGPSGCGKSDLALRLIDRGALLVSDDYTRLTLTDGRLIASPPPTIAGRIEVRGLGIITLPYVHDLPVALRVDAGLAKRMPAAQSCDIAGVVIPLLHLALLEASAPLKVELALARLP